MMGAALVALTASMLWAGHKIPMDPFDFPGLLTLSATSDIVKDPTGLMGVKSPNYDRAKHSGRCRFSRSNHPIIPDSPPPSKPAPPPI